MMKKIIIIILGLFLLSIQNVFADVDSKGSDFIFALMPNLDPLITPITELHIVSQITTSVTIEYPVNSPTFTNTISVTPGVTIIRIPPTSAQSWTAGTVQNNAIQVSSADEVTVYAVNRYNATSDAALVLPVDALGMEYIGIGYTSNDVYPYYSELVVVASEDNTSVTITPSSTLTTGQTSGVPFVISLNRGDGYMIQSMTDITGTTISSDKPVEVSNGSGCSKVPLNIYACDTLFEIAQPITSWDRQIFLVNLPDRPNGVIYRVMGSASNTVIYQDGAMIGTINKGQFLEIGPINGNHELSGNKPIFVTQYVTGYRSLNAISGDPSMTNVIPVKQYLTNYAFSAVGGNQFQQHFMTIMADNRDISTIQLDGSPIGATNFSPIGTSGFSAAVLTLSQGTHRTSSTHGHGIIVGGYALVDSYLYPGGAKFENINPTMPSNYYAVKFHCGYMIHTKQQEGRYMTVENPPLETGSYKTAIDIHSNQTQTVRWHASFSWPDSYISNYAGFTLDADQSREIDCSDIIDKHRWPFRSDTDLLKGFVIIESGDLDVVSTYTNEHQKRSHHLEVKVTKSENPVNVGKIYNFAIDLPEGKNWIDVNKQARDNLSAHLNELGNTLEFLVLSSGIETNTNSDIDVEKIEPKIMPSTISSIQTLPSIPSLSINNVSVTEGNSGTTTATFQVTLSQTSSSPVTVSYTISPTGTNPATSGVDYSGPTTGTITIPANTASWPVTVTIIGDTVYEQNETFSVTLSAPTGATILVGTGLGTILNDDVSTISLIINGTKFHDLTPSNHIKDGVDPGLNNWNITLFTPSGVKIASTLTTNKPIVNTPGWFQLSAPPGNYVLCEKNEFGWYQTRAYPGFPVTGMTSCSTFGPAWSTYGYSITPTSSLNKDFGNNNTLN